MTQTITKTLFFKAPPARVWAFLTKKDKLAQWFHPARADLAAGADYALLADGSPDAEPLCWGTVTHWQPPRRLVYSFTAKPFEGVLSTVTWQLEDALGGTRLTLTHEGVTGAKALALLMGLDKGWDEHFGRLRHAVANT